MLDESVVIDWRYQGKPDYSFGTGATRAEYLLGWAGAALGVCFYIYLGLQQALPWALWQYLLAALLAFDVAGGLVCNSLNSCKRFYMTPPEPAASFMARLIKNHMVFTALHLHSVVIGLLYGPPNWLFAFGWYAALLASTLVVLRTPLYLRRPMAMLIIMIAIIVNASLIAPIQGFEWLIPALFIKIVYGHSVREEPYRPGVKGEKRSLNSFGVGL